MSLKEIKGTVSIMNTSGGLLLLGSGSLRLQYVDHRPHTASIYLSDTGELPPPDRLRDLDLAYVLIRNEHVEYKVIFKLYRWIHAFGATKPESLRGNISTLTCVDITRKKEDSVDDITEITYSVPEISSLSYQLGWFRYQALEKLLDIDRIAKSSSHLSEFGVFPFRYAPAVLAIDENESGDSFDLVLRHTFTFYLKNAPFGDDAILTTDHVITMLLEIIGFLDNQEYAYDSVAVKDPFGRQHTVYKPAAPISLRSHVAREHHDLATYFRAIATIANAVFEKAATERLKTFVAMRRLVRSTEHEEIPVRAMYYHASLSYLLEVLSPSLAVAPYAKRSLARSYEDGNFAEAQGERKTLSDFDRYRNQLLDNGFLFDDDKAKTSNLVRNVIPIISKVFSRVCCLDERSSAIVREFLQSNYSPIPFDENTAII